MTPEPRKSPYIDMMILFFQSSPTEQRRLARELDEALSRHTAKLQAQAQAQAAARRRLATN